MCLNPIIIDNKNFGIRGSPGTPKYYKHTKLSKIVIPCGYCKECITNKQMGYIQRIMEESKKNEFYMITLTYKEEMIPKYTIGKYTFRYAETQDFIAMCKRMDTWRERHDKKHKYIPYPFRYFAVTELGSNGTHRPHFHALIAINKKYLPDKAACLNAEKDIYWAIRDNWCRNVAGARRKAKYEPLFEYHERWQRGILKRNYDCHYVDKEKSKNGIEDCAWYVMKYMLKDCNVEKRRQQALKLNLNEADYEKTWELIKTKRFYSTGWGLNPTKNPFGDIEPDEDIEKHIRQCIEKSKNNYPYPCWINEFNGKYFPLCRYYKEKFLKLEDMPYFFNENWETEYELPDMAKSRDQENRFKEIKRKHDLSALTFI